MAKQVVKHSWRNANWLELEGRERVLLCVTAQGRELLVCKGRPESSGELGSSGDWGLALGCPRGVQEAALHREHRRCVDAAVGTERGNFKQAAMKMNYCSCLVNV